MSFHKKKPQEIKGKSCMVSGLVINDFLSRENSLLASHSNTAPAPLWLTDKRARQPQKQAMIVQGQGTPQDVVFRKIRGAFPSIASE
jgi:hypothetical protein